MCCTNRKCCDLPERLKGVPKASSAYDSRCYSYTALLFPWDSQSLLLADTGFLPILPACLITAMLNSYCAALFLFSTPTFTKVYNHGGKQRMRLQSLGPIPGSLLSLSWSLPHNHTLPGKARPSYFPSGPECSTSHTQSLHITPWPVVKLERSPQDELTSPCWELLVINPKK